MTPAPWGEYRWCVEDSNGDALTHFSEYLILFWTREAACQWIARQEAKR